MQQAVFDLDRSVYGMRPSVAEPMHQIVLKLWADVTEQDNAWCAAALALTDPAYRDRVAIIEGRQGRHTVTEFDCNYVVTTVDPVCLVCLLVPALPPLPPDFG